jgi:hypothetical protein
MKRLSWIIILLCISIKSFCWGFYTHKLVNYYAVFLLPPEMMVLYKANITFITEHAVDPDKRRYAVQEEGPRHYIDMDRYGRPPHDLKGLGWKEAVERYSEDTLKAHGIVPWWIVVMLNRLTKAFHEKNQAKILRLSAEIGHYIGDAHVPLHACSNHNGQYTNQRGIHGFWESRVPELLAEKEWDFLIGRAEYLAKPLGFIWDRVEESAAASDSVLSLERKLNEGFPAERKYAFEDRNGLTVKQYSSEYSVAYNKMLDNMIERRFRQSVFAVASFWYTAWVNAGQPGLTQLVNKDFTESEIKEFDELTMQWKNGRVKGKSCD